MKQSKLLIPTLREIPSDTEGSSQTLLLRAGYIRQIAGGVYGYLPLANRVLEKIKKIIREEFEKIDAFEMSLPTLIPSELEQEAPCSNSKMEEFFRLSDRSDKEYSLGYAREEIVTKIVAKEITSYKRFPMNLFQFQTEFRDEKRPRYGLLRSREFLVSDAYSFHVTEENLSEVYEKYAQALTRIFERCGLSFQRVNGDSGLLGGYDAKGFMIISEIGKTTLCFSDTSDYVSERQCATSLYTSKKSHESLLELEEIETPNCRTIMETAEFLELSPQKFIKSVFFMADETPLLVLVRGDDEVSQLKVMRKGNFCSLREGTEEEARTYLEADLDSIGPVLLPENVKVYADLYVKDLANAIVGAKKSGFHLKNVNPGRDFQPDDFDDFRLVQKGDLSPDGKGVLQFKQGYEVGHIFKLGQRYSEKLEADILNENGERVPLLIGCYSIGISSLLAACVEQGSDENGIIWSEEIAPFAIHVVQMSMEESEQTELTKSVEEDLIKAGYQVLVDDRKERAGVKFVDADLIGCPTRLTIGKKAREGIVEIKLRKTGDTVEVRKEDLVSTLHILLNHENN